MNVVILAAGMGKRMQSDLPKVLHPLAGKPLLSHVIDTARHLAPSACCVVYGHGGDAVPSQLAAHDLQFVLQQPQLGTGHAVMQAVPHLHDDQPTLVLYGDVPLTSASTLQTLISRAGKEKLAVLTVELDDPNGYGRIIREAGRIVRIVEQKDASDTERAIREVNTGILVAPTRALKSWLSKLSNNNAQGEYYLTDIIAQAVSDNIPVESAQPAFVWETLGVNSKVQLAELERIHQHNGAHQLLEQGVTWPIQHALMCAVSLCADVM
jgi:bifunctional UDP-N-acetylglucosamine pyrophosphorylase / glucosamine-1-phosphate N-acetyltransferase